ncbi:hypothetical protein ACO0QE_003724 [Hanseniaspora vineae]
MESVGLVITAKQHHYPIELSNLELLSHYETIQDYHQELSNNIVMKNFKFKPDLKLILQQPEMCPLDSFRFQIVNFLYQLSYKTRVTQGIFQASCRLYDRYCSKRIVLQDQAKLVISTCLWMTAKTHGGCNHIINNISVPTGGRFYGPNPRARIPRLNELIHYCGGYDKYDESMFVQMEKHILDTLQWDIMEPLLNDYILNVDENCLIQYELYQRQLASSKASQGQNNTTTTTNNNNTTRGSSNSTDTESDYEEDEDLQDKIQLINVKNFLIDLSCWQLELLQFEYFEIAHGIFKLINKVLPPSPQVTAHPHTSILLTPQTNAQQTNKVVNIFLDAIVSKKLPSPLMQQYSKNYKVMEFVALCSTKLGPSLFASDAGLSNGQNSNNTNNEKMVSSSTANGYGTQTPQHSMHSNNSSAEMNHMISTGYATPPSSRTASTSVANTSSSSILSQGTTSTNSSQGNTPYMVQGKTFVSGMSHHHQLQQQQPSPITPGIGGPMMHPLQNNTKFCFSTDSTTNNGTKMNGNNDGSCKMSNSTQAKTSSTGAMGIGLIHQRG